MVFSFHVYRKSAPNGKLSVYVGRRDYTDHLTHVDPIDGMVWLERDYVKERRVFAQVVMTYRYGREEDEVMGLTFARDMVVASAQVYPPSPLTKPPNSLQERLQKKLGVNSFPFHLEMPRSAPASVTLQQGKEETGRPCGVQWELRIFVGANAEDQPQRRSCVRLLIRRFQYAPAKQGRKPTASCTKEFLLSPGKLHLQVALDRQIYYHEEAVKVAVTVSNQSNKQVKKVKVGVVQLVEVSLGPAGHVRNTVASIESQDGCPVVPGAGLTRSFSLTPTLRLNQQRRGVAVDGRLKSEDTNLASSTLFTNPDHRDKFGIVVSYVARVKLSMGTLGGELAAEVPFTLMNPPLEETGGGEAAEAPRDETDRSTRLIIEECRRMSLSDLLEPQKSEDSVDKEDKEEHTEAVDEDDVFKTQQADSQVVPLVE
ncbi:arrestin homolog [Portunus trituberculatus]|uniref:arrestin homolog n=1 Tax=Portunus trituberculatus TaxID=210409 RepID=UPI001E1D039F|nr:arrestin homolog [Portunus trituberculatus]